jgi:transcriptional regulator of acetoin/glycerol metabolism
MKSPAPGQTTDALLADNWSLFRVSKPSVLLIGAEHETDRAIQSITANSADTVAAWPQVDAGPPSPAAGFTLLVRDVASLDAHEQARLHRWLGERSGAVRVITTSSVSLYGLVEQRQFLEPLYYRLNVVCLDAAAFETASV